MKFISNTRLGARLSMAFGLVLLLLLLISGFALNSMSKIQANLNGIVDVTNVKLDAANRMGSILRDMAVLDGNVIMLTEEADMQAQVKLIEESAAKFKSVRDELTPLVVTPEGKAMLADIDRLLVASTALNKQVMKLALVNRNEEATQLALTKSQPAMRATVQAVEDFIDRETRWAEEIDAASAQNYEESRLLVVTLAVVSALLATGIAIIVTRSVTGPLREAVAVAEKVAAGDLSSRVEVTSKDETGQLMGALRAMNESLSKVVGEVRSGTDTIATASSEIASGNQDLSSRTEEQASSLQQTAASMEELTSTVKQNADNARQANQLAESASEVAVRGGAVVSQVVDTMGSINTSSRKIVDIIAVIDGIAFQTNILALNAAVEAARAGEQGRGFAVVASEVRSLAQRSASAAKEIKQLIDDSVGKVEEGSHQVAEAGRTMEEIVESVKRVTDIMGEITVASQEQTSGIEQINQAITQMDQVTQQNAALVEEAAAAAASLQEQAGGLVQSVSVFKVGSDEAAARVIAQARNTSREPVRPAKRAAVRSGAGSAGGAKASAAAAGGNDWTEF